jgi:hypothetical protein
LLALAHSFSEWARAKNFRLPAPGEAKRISRCVAKAQQAEKSAAGKGKGGKDGKSH